jgi:hypothetical protein
MTRAQVIATITSALHCMNREYSGLLAGNNNADADAELKEVLTWIKKKKSRDRNTGPRPHLVSSHRSK